MPSTYSVSQINSYIKNMFAQDFFLGSVFITGEISNLKYHQTGHVYFTLKDEGAAISCVMFSSDRQRMTFRMEEGQSVIVGGSISVYERYGTYQMYAKSVKLSGAGTLAEEFEKLKARLAESGMFDEMYKSPIPKYIKTLGVVTAPTGAAIRDIINVAKRRNPGIQIILYPAIVQGDQAPLSIITGIKALERYGVDVMIVGRGGGSAEDLWGFNDENVARAIFDCDVPIISAVGHETDFTIADFVASMRAPTPSAAAEIAVTDMAETMRHIDSLRKNLTMSFKVKFTDMRQSLETMRHSLMRLSPESRLKDQRYRLMTVENDLSALMSGRVDEAKRRLEIDIERLKGLSPLDKLSQGYSHVADSEGRTVNDVSKVKKGESLTISVRNGRIYATVDEVEHGSKEKNS